jgi:hypothetical protein
MGFVLNKHRYPTWFRSWIVMRPLLGAAVAMMTGRFGQMRMRWQRAMARARGVLLN